MRQADSGSDPPPPDAGQALTAGQSAYQDGTRLAEVAVSSRRSTCCASRSWFQRMPPWVLLQWRQMAQPRYRLNPNLSSVEVQGRYRHGKLAGFQGRRRHCGPAAAPLRTLPHRRTSTTNAPVHVQVRHEDERGARNTRRIRPGRGRACACASIEAKLWPSRTFGEGHLRSSNREFVFDRDPSCRKGRIDTVKARNLQHAGRTRGSPPCAAGWLK